MKRDKSAETVIKEIELDALERKLSTRFGEQETKLKECAKSECKALEVAHESKSAETVKKQKSELDALERKLSTRFQRKPQETKLKAFAKRQCEECKALVAAHESKIPPRLLDTLPQVGSSGNFNFHDKLIRKVGPGANSSDVVIKAQLDGTLAEAKKHAENLFHVHKELVKNDYSNLETKIEKLEKVDVKKVLQEDIDKRTASFDKAMTTRSNALREEVDKRIKVCEEKLKELETDYSLLDARLTSFSDTMIINFNKLRDDVAVDIENLEKINKRLVLKGILDCRVTDNSDCR
ncbi:hypothetical protein R5R35_006177 [Gryllus longicercus]|uniref:Uncharacterized protein n=1 Tax=Gryllus longicercus TaxID=2509291 RepID=A0AAN9VUM9_9ORTH